jgi:K+-sensing histidine kinase KdpD
METLPRGQQRDKYLYLLSEISDIVSSSLADKDIYEGVLWELSSGLDLDAIWVQNYDPVGKILNLSSQRGLPEQLIKEIQTVIVGHGVIGKIAQERKPVFTNDISKDRNCPWESATRLGYHSFIASPVITGGRFVGLLGGLSYKSDLFTLNDLKLIYVVTACISDVCDRAGPENNAQDMAKQQGDMAHTQLFLSALGHELKTPLTAIIASTGLLLDELETRKEATLLKVAQNIARSADSLKNRLTELLSLSRTRDESFGIKMKEMDFSKLAMEVVGEISSLIKQKRQILDVEVPPKIKIVGDDQRIEQILLNLLSNAIKFSPEGGQIGFKASTDENRLLVNITDSGPGIFDEEKQKLFRPYYHLATDRASLPRIGLGLAITRQLVELHGGAIWVNSEVGKGSTFSFSLPLTFSYSMPLHSK